MTRFKWIFWIIGVALGTLFNSSHIVDSSSFSSLEKPLGWSSKENTNGKVIFCYYRSFAQTRQVPGHFVPEDVDPSLCTHLIFAFADVINGRRLKPTNWNDALPGGKGLYNRTISLKKINPNLKVLLALGGWTIGSTPFTAITAQPENQRYFILYMVNYLRRFEFDGIDMDWEFPGSRGSPREDKFRFTLLMEGIQEAFVRESERTGRDKLLLTFAAAAGSHFIQSAYELDKLAHLVDYALVMTYNYHGSWDRVTGHHSPLYAHSDEWGNDRQLNQNWTLEHYLAAGFPRHKLVVGVATYGMSYSLVNARWHGLQAPVTGAGTPGPYTKEPGILAYYEICELVSDGGWQSVWVDEMRVPYAYKGKQWVGYDDVTSVAYKARNIVNMELGGAFVWSVEMDDFSARCGQKYPLLSTINRIIKQKYYHTPDQNTRGKLHHDQFGANERKRSTDPNASAADEDFEFRRQEERLLKHTWQLAPHDELNSFSFPKGNSATTLHENDHAFFIKRAEFPLDERTRMVTTQQAVKESEEPRLTTSQAMTQQGESRLVSRQAMPQQGEPRLASRQAVTQQGGPKLASRQAMTQQVETRLALRQAMIQQGEPRLASRQAMTQQVEPRLATRQAVIQQREPRLATRQAMTQQGKPSLALRQAMTQQVEPRLTLRQAMTQQETRLATRQAMTQKRKPRLSLRQAMTQQGEPSLTSRQAMTQQETRLATRQAMTQKRKPRLSLRQAMTQQGEPSLATEADLAELSSFSPSDFDIIREVQRVETEMLPKRKLLLGLLADDHHKPQAKHATISRPTDQQQPRTSRQPTEPPRIDFLVRKLPAIVQILPVKLTASTLEGAGSRVVDMPVVLQMDHGIIRPKYAETEHHVLLADHHHALPVVVNSQHVQRQITKKSLASKDTVGLRTVRDEAWQIEADLLPKRTASDGQCHIKGLLPDVSSCSHYFVCARNDGPNGERWEKTRMECRTGYGFHTTQNACVKDYSC